MRAREGSLWINRRGQVQHEAGMAGVCTILPHAKPWGFSLETLQCKERRLEGRQAAPEPWCLSDGGPVFQAWLLARMHWS